MKIGIISDTHGLLRPEVIEHLEGSSLILHAGDINRQEILDKLEQIAPVRVVRGNNDKEWAEDIPYLQGVMCGGFHILMCHKKKDVSVDLSDVDLVVYGHSHKYADQMEKGVRWLNPGSCGPRRFNQEITMAVMELKENEKGVCTYEIQRIDIPHAEKAVKLPQEKCRAEIVKEVIKGINKGLSSERIAAKYHLDVEFVEEISRIYLTHPGIGIDGILNRLK